MSLTFKATRHQRQTFISITAPNVASLGKRRRLVKTRLTLTYQRAGKNIKQGQAPHG